MHGRTYGASTSIVAVNSKIHPGDLCPDRDPQVSDLDAYLEIRKEKETLRAAHISKDTSVKCKHLEHRIGSNGEEVTINFDQIAKYPGSNPTQEVFVTSDKHLEQQNNLELKGALIRTRPNLKF